MKQDVCVDAGLALVFDDGSRLDLTPDATAAVVGRWLTDSEAISPGIRTAKDFQPCEICPICERGDLCRALRPLLPIAELARDADLQSGVTVVAEGAAADRPAQTLRTTLQRAMQSVALLSLVNYCGIGNTHRRLFRGVSMIMGLEEIAERVAGNMFLETDGDPKKMGILAGSFSQDLQAMSHGQIGRLRLFCQDHPLIDAIINAQIVLECLIDEKAEAHLSETPLCSF